MKRISWLAAAVLVCSFAPAAGEGNPLDEALRKAGLDPQEVRLNPGRWRGGGRYSLSVFDRLWDDWRAIDKEAERCAGELPGEAKTFSGLVRFGATMIDANLPERTTEAAEGGRLAEAILALHEALGDPLDDARRADLQERAKAVPANVARAAATMLRVVPGALAARGRGFAGFGGEDALTLVTEKARTLALEHSVDEDTLRLLEKVDLAALVEGGMVLAGAMDSARGDIEKGTSGEFGFTWETPAGKVAINGAGTQEYAAEEYLLIIDTGGDDVYQWKGAGSGAVSVILDVAGNDRYEGEGTGGAGAAIAGYAFVWDGSGNDAYRAESAGLGVGAFGVGVLMDAAGNDTYDVRRLGQGAAVYGIGALTDLGGNDQYHCFQLAQGYGATRGCGILADLAGDDAYVADDETLDFPSVQTAAHNTSLAQGCGFGRRAHPGDGNSLAGGVGVLLDASGDDKYSAGLFAQGAAYWYSLGLLLDLAGNDEYAGVWYVQGSAVHYAVSELLDVEGNDHYFSLLSQNTGHAKDQSTGILHDVKGDDVYESRGGFVLGSANWDSIGVLWDGQGEDRYSATSACLGYARDCSAGINVGLIVDEGGQAEFPADDLAKAGTWWLRPQSDPHSYGVGSAE